MPSLEVLCRPQLEFVEFRVLNRSILKVGEHELSGFDLYGA